MAATLLVCPDCAACFPAANGRARCPQCGTEAVTTRAKADVPVSRPYAPPPEYPKAEEAPPAGPSRRALLLVLCGAGFLLLCGAAVVIVVALSSDKAKTGAVAQVSPQVTARADEDRPPPPTEVTRGGSDDPGIPQPPKRDPIEAPPSLTSLSEAEQKEVTRAIERGTAYLKKHSPAGPMGNHRFSGLHPLVGLTLLEGGVPADDLALSNLTRRIRADAAKLSETYSLSLAILFFDRLGDPQDKKLIRFLAARLIAGQNEAGGWSYDCPELSESDSQSLFDYLETNPVPGQSMKGSPGLPLVIRPRDTSRSLSGDTGRSAKPVSRDALPAMVKNRPVVVFEPGKTKPRWGKDDNSNTQFAVLGVWAARRHGVPIDRSVALISARFRKSQNSDGSWGYNVDSTKNRDSMTCAGLLGLAVGRAGGESAEKDPAIAHGLQFLGRKVGQPASVKAPRKGHVKPLQIGAESIGDMYWLWSVERVGVIYNLPTIGGKDWYAWGAGLLVKSQNEEGDWRDAGQGLVVDTCFALLFLQRVNVAKDLTRQLQMIGPIRDPGPTHDK